MPTDRETESKDFANKGEAVSPISNGASPRSHKANYQRLVTPDPAAFRYLEEDPSTTVLERRRRLTGYELYFVEQWGCSRVHPTFCIVTHTGLEHHSIVVGVLSIPTDESAWSPRLRVYLKAITKYHARKRETPVGTLMVTNLSGFPSALTVVPVPDGDIKIHREDFVVNENLKRLNCSGRAGLNILPPTSATQTKFTQSYRTSDQIPISAAVIELIKLCQVALMFFDKLSPEYVDGLLCDVTETAINEWWSDIGSDIFNIDPSDGILGPTTVAALLGLLMGARKRLSAFGAPTPKDVFDILATKRAIAYFQKCQKMERSRRLDKPTLIRLHKVTAKAASGEGWTVPRAVKSTVAELSGKGGELVNGRGDKAGIAEVESLDIETFVRLGAGDRFKWLWHGKPKKNAEEAFGSIVGEDGWVFNDNEEGGYRWTNKRKDSFDDDQSLRHGLSDHLYLNHFHNSQTSMDHLEKDRVLRKAVLKNVTGRVKGVVGKGRSQGQQQRSAMDESTVPDVENMGDTPGRESTESTRLLEVSLGGSAPDTTHTHSRATSKGGSGDSSRLSSKSKEWAARGTSTESSYRDSTDNETPMVDSGKRNPRSDYLELIDSADGITSRRREHEDMEDVQKRSRLMDDSFAIKKMEHFDWASAHLPPLRATRSFSYLLNNKTPTFWERKWPRQMSFTAMVDVVATSQPPPTTSEDHDLTSTDPDAALAFERSAARQNNGMEMRLQRIKATEVPWVDAKVTQIEAYDQQCSRDQSRLDVVYHHKTEENHALQEASEELLHQERAALSDARQEIETLSAKLEYELSALQGKVEDVEDAVEEFEKQADLIEARVREQLVTENHNKGKSEGWFRWLGTT